MAARTKYTVTHNGETVTRTSTRAYTHASLAVFPWRSAESFVYGFHASEALALNAHLEGSQKRNGARIVGALPVRTA